jgi:hypothetical protein
VPISEVFGNLTTCPLTWRRRKIRDRKIFSWDKHRDVIGRHSSRLGGSIIQEIISRIDGTGKKRERNFLEYNTSVHQRWGLFSERQTKEIREAREGNIAVPIIKCHTDLCTSDETRARNPRSAIGDLEICLGDVHIPRSDDHDDQVAFSRLFLCTLRLFEHSSLPATLRSPDRYICITSSSLRPTLIPSFVHTVRLGT